MANITNIPAPRVPFIDERTGLISREWFRFLNNQFVLTGSGTTATSISDLEVGLGLSPDTDDVTAVLQTEIEDLQKAPPYLETILSNLSKLNYGMFYDTTDQAAAVINTAYPITFNTTSVALGTYRGSPTSRIYVSTPAVYNFAFSVQLDKTSGGLARMYFWGRKNGTLRNPPATSTCKATTTKPCMRLTYTLKWAAVTILNLCGLPMIRPRSWKPLLLLHPFLPFRPSFLL